MKLKLMEFLRKIAPLFRRKLAMAGAAMIILGLIIGLFAIFSGSKPTSITSTTVSADSSKKYQVKGLSTHDQHNDSHTEGEETTVATSGPKNIPNTPQKKTEDTPKVKQPTSNNPSTPATTPQTPKPTAITKISARFPIDVPNAVFSWTADGKPGEGYVFTYNFPFCYANSTLPCGGEKRVYTDASTGSFSLLTAIPNIDAFVKLYGNNMMHYSFAELRNGVSYNEIGGARTAYLCSWDNNTYQDVRFDGCGFTR